MGKICISILVSVFLFGTFAAEQRTCKASFSKDYPVLDGDVNHDPAWSAVPWSEGSFYLHRQKVPPKNDTRFKALYTDDALYLAVECMEPDVSKLKKVYNFGEFWNYDTVEVFFLPKDRELIQLIGNYEGMKQDQFDGNVAKRTGYKTGWGCAARLGKDRWTVEFCIPFFLLGVVPDRKEVSMPFNLCRNSVSANERSTWSFQSGPFKNVKDFGRLVLAQAPQDKRTVMEASLRRPHWSSLVERWQSVRKDPGWKEIFDRYPAEYTELEKMYADPKNYPYCAGRFHTLLSTLEKFSGEQEESHNKRIMKRLFDE